MFFLDTYPLQVPCDRGCRADREPARLQQNQIGHVLDQDVNKHQKLLHHVLNCDSILFSKRNHGLFVQVKECLVQMTKLVFIFNTGMK